MSFCHHLIVLKLSLSINPYLSDFSSLMSLCCVTVADAFVAAATQEHNGAFLHFLSALWCNCQVWLKKTDPVHPPTAAWTHTHIRVCVCVCVCITFHLLLRCQSNACMSYKHMFLCTHRCFEGLQIKADFTECMFRHGRLHCRDMRDKRAVSQHRRGWCVLWCFWWDQCPLRDSPGSLHSRQAKDELTSDTGEAQL